MVTSVPNSFEEAERLQKDHQQFENAIEVGWGVFKVSTEDLFLTKDHMKRNFTVKNLPKLISFLIVVQNES